VCVAGVGSIGRQNNGARCGRYRAYRVVGIWAKGRRELAGDEARKLLNSV
jgi:hypothetical protein